jgi:nitric oxide dioxygenase
LGRFDWHGPEIAQQFYERLFQLHPEYRKLFKEDNKEQHRKLAFAITLVVTKLDKLDQIAEEVRSLSARHAKYGVKPEYFEPFIKLFVETIAKVRADRWKPEYSTAWYEVMKAVGDAIAGNMSAIK